MENKTAWIVTVSIRKVKFLDDDTWIDDPEKAIDLSKTLDEVDEKTMEELTSGKSIKLDICKAFRTVLCNVVCDLTKRIDEMKK